MNEQRPSYVELVSRANSSGYLPSETKVRRREKDEPNNDAKDDPGSDRVKREFKRE